MYILEYLKEIAIGGNKPGKTVEYRLACSGELFNSVPKVWDHQKEAICRMLLRSPFELFVTSNPFNDYPQELALRFSLREITETVVGKENGFKVLNSFLPDRDVVEDLCSVLTLLSRRLIVPIFKTREKSAETLEAFGSFAEDYPTPVLPLRSFSSWRPRPATVITSFNGSEVELNAPPAVGVDPAGLRRILVALPTANCATAIMNACRFYQTALELIESRPDIAYQLLISTVETLAGVAPNKYEPGEAEMVKYKTCVFERAKAFTLDDSQATRLAIDACRGERWIKKNFVKFLVDYGRTASIRENDPLYYPIAHLYPAEADFEPVLKDIYDARSSNLHSGDKFPTGIGLGTSAMMPMREMAPLLVNPPPLPPVIWFERVVSAAARKFFMERVSAEQQAFRDEAH
jgi:hypothetical protein